MDKIPHMDPHPQTDESIRRAKWAMYQERIANNICPVCEPAQMLDPWTGTCPNPFCLFAAFAQPLPSRAS